MPELDQIIEAWLVPSVKAWFIKQSANLGQRHYLYFKSGDEHSCGALTITTEPLNDQWELVTGEPVSPAMSPNEVIAWATKLAWKLPLLKKA